MAKFSIILPVRDGGDYIKECVQSVLNQTYTNFELLVLIHDSTDATQTWLSSLHDSRIQILYATNIDGINGNWQRIVALPKSEYMTILGYDDILYPSFLAEMNVLIEHYPTAALYQTHFHYINAEGCVLRTCRPFQPIMNQASFLKGVLCGELDLMATGFVMRSKDYDAIGGIGIHFPNLLYADVHLFLELLRRGDLVTSTHIRFAYRRHNSTTNISKNDIVLNALVVFLSSLQQLQQIEPLAEVIRQNIQKFITQQCLELSHRLLKTKSSNRLPYESVKRIVETLQQQLLMFNVQDYKLVQQKSIALAQMIDSHNWLRKLFYWIKTVQQKPYYGNFTQRKLHNE